MTTPSTIALGVLVGALPVAAADELMRNGGFEAPAIAPETQSETIPSDWQWFSSIEGSKKIVLTAKTVHEGKQAVRMSVQRKADSYQGLFQAFPASLGVSYEFKAFVRNDSASPLRGLARGQMSVEWKDAGGSEIERVWGPEWGESLSVSQWTRVEMAARPPANAVTAHFVITQFDGKGEAGSGAFLVDEVMLQQNK
jgi:hypothetical protein